MLELDNIEFNHSEKIQMRFNDIDVLGHVNNAIQITYFDYGKVHYFESLKKQIIDWSGSDLVMVHFEVDFMEPIFRGNNIEVKTKVYEIGNKSVKLVQILQDETTGHIKSVCRSVMCGFDAKTNESIIISDEWRNLIQKFEKFRP
ncbi:MAG: acyl-CoA thioesterase [Paludibacteraceae bacterium]|nr:acyl-CoA thioesterase [Paludibacteraceae bacterium]HOU67033.1 thioesterase family protein [Paludibacteraceae bacterium]HQF50241.1 thioesterase family protein [Paludibacteraceae bacterium]HQJ90478.1 thioesterase family protein [Paludibacteraceae bacterium]